MRVLLDTNVLVAAFATRGLCEDVFRVVLAEHDLLVGESILTEIRRVLEEKLRLPEARAREIVRFVRDQAEVIVPAEPAHWPEGDPDDQWVVAAALEGDADTFVTGDKLLLEVADQAGISVVTPRGFWERIR